MLQVDVASLHTLPGEMKLDVNVLATIVQHKILRQGNCTSVVHLDGRHQNSCIGYFF
jgi:hypothetical protein